jgi:hypothetical protein
MRKISAGLFVSLDGVVESPNEWTGPYFSDEVGQTVGILIAGGDTLLLGRVTYEGFAQALRMRFVTLARPRRGVSGHGQHGSARSWGRAPIHGQGSVASHGPAGGCGLPLCQTPVRHEAEVNLCSE